MKKIEEKKVTKISLSTFFLILAIIVIIIMSLFLYKLNNDKTTEIEKSTELQAQVNNLNTTVSKLQEKANTLSNTTYNHNISSENNNTSNATSSNNTSNATSSNNTSKNLTNKITLDGYYAFESSDIGYEFHSNGTVSILGNVSEEKGTYTTSGENEITITLKEMIIVDTDSEIFKTTSTPMNKTEIIKIVDENTLLLSDDDVKNEKLVRFERGF